MSTRTQAPDQAPRTPRRRFRRLKELRQPHSGGGSGGARTLLCRDQDNGQLCAVKLLRRASGDLENAANEILNMRSCIAHPFVVHFKQARASPRHFPQTVTRTGAARVEGLGATRWC